jgi:ribose 5-phosphate isomerase A
MSDAKRAAGDAAANLVTSGMKLGLGTGSTTAFALEAIGRRVREEGLRVFGVPTSFAAERLARKYGIPLTSLDAEPHLDLALDGADEVDPSLGLIKGRGAAHTREKVVAAQAREFVVLVDPSKEVERLGTKFAVPVEVLPLALAPVMLRLERLGAEPTVREGQAKDGPVVTDQGFFVIDARFAEGLDDPERVAAEIGAMPGVLEHGLFLGMATGAIIGEADGSVRRRGC